MYVYWREYQLYKGQTNTELMAEHLNNMSVAYQTNMEVWAKDRETMSDRKVHSPAFLTGAAGLHTLGALLYKETGNMTEMLRSYKELMNCLSLCKGKHALDDLLFGNAGYLYCLLTLYGTDSTLFNCKSEIMEVVSLLKKEGLAAGSKEMLLFPYPRESSKLYYGAAHGLMGILYMIIKAITMVPQLEKDVELLSAVEKSCEFVLAKQYPSGNFPSSHGSTDDRLVHFCHGAAGAIPFLLAAYRTFKRDAYLTAALKAGEAVWAKGILKKGNGICHGITGNGYTFHSLYRATGDDKWKYRCQMLADASWNEEIQAETRVYKDPQRLVKGKPDTPYSLMEGLGGTAVFYADLLGKAEAVRFPGYEL